MGDLSRMSRSTRFIGEMNKHVRRENLGKVFKLVGVNLGMDNSDGYAVNLYGNLREVDTRGRVKPKGDSLDVALEDGHIFDPDWTDRDDFVEMCRDRFGMSEEDAERVWEKVDGP